MASSSGGDVPAERAAAAAVKDVIEAREGVDRLKGFLVQMGDHRAPWAELVADGVLNRLSNAISALDDYTAGATAGGQSPAARSDGAIRPQPSSVSSSGNTKKRSFSRRTQRAYEQRITATLDDGHVWRKYGQKEIQNSQHPRSYFRCTHKSDQGCNAKRHVQLRDADPSNKYVVTYYGDHTCSRDPSRIIHAAAGGSGANNLISFAPPPRSCTGGASLHMVATTDGNASSDDVLSSSAGLFMQADELGAVVGSSAAVMSARTLAADGSAPDSTTSSDVHMMPAWPDGRGTGAGGSFPSSPNNNNLGFEVGDDDDFFRLDLDP